MLRRAGFRVLMLSTELGEDRLESALRALEPTAILVCGPEAHASDAARLLTKVRALGVDVPLFNFRAAALAESAAAIPSAGNVPSDVTALLNADLRRRAAAAFA